MANLRRHGSGPYYLEFRFQGRKFQRSLRTKNKAEATRLLGVVEQTVEYLERGVLAVPSGTSANELWRFFVSGWKVAPARKATLLASRRLSDVCSEYIASYADGAKEASTLKTERLHLSHFERIIGKSVEIGSLTSESLEDYVHARQQEKEIRSRKVSPTTIGKELATFGLLWKFALRREWASAENPAAAIPKPRGNQKPAFLTWRRRRRRCRC